MSRNRLNGVRKLAVVAFATLVAACAGTGAMRSLTSSDVAGIKEGMTREQVEQALGPSPAPTRDNKGNTVLDYYYSGRSGEQYKGHLFVTVDSASGKVVRIDNRPPH